MAGPTQREIYFFDLRGYLLLEGAISPEHVAQLNSCLDELPRREPGQWHGHIRYVNYGTADGLNLQQIYEAGEPFEKLIDHPAWIDKVKHFVGGEGTFDHHHGPVYIDENFANFRGAGEAIGLHSGGHERTKRTQFRCHNGKFHCGQINILMALTDIGPGDGATMVVPASHKANFEHPDDAAHHMKQGELTSVDRVQGATEVLMKAGDVLLFVDAICHGSAERTNDGERRIVVYRYGPSWGRSRHGYEASAALLSRLTPQQRQIVQPQVVLSPPGE